MPLVITRDPDNGSRNVGTYRMQVIDERTTFMHWQLHKTGARHWRRHVELKKRMPAFLRALIAAIPCQPVDSLRR